jgi:hypothetical protein
MNKPTKPITSDKPRGSRVAAVLNSAATLVADVAVGAMSHPKLPPMFGD